MDATSTRARNVAMLVEQAGGPTAFGKLIERDQVQVSQWTSETKPKPIGGRLARYIEGKLGHEKGWLDQPQWRSLEPALPSQSQAVRLDPAMIAETVKALRIDAERTGHIFSMETDEGAALFLHWYAIRERVPDLPTLTNLIQLRPTLENALSPQGAKINERGEGVPIAGAHGPRKAGGGAGRKA